MSDISIVNSALTLLGESRIISLADNTKPAREANAIFEITRDSLLAAYNWSFAKTRAQLPALADAPLFEFNLQYQIPTDCLRLLQIGDFYVGLDLTDYRGSPVDQYVIEGRKILTNLSAPLNVKYIKRVENSTEFSKNFEMAFVAKLAEVLAEPLTQSDQKRQRATDAFNREIKAAIRANAIELPPTKLPDDEWLISRI